ncbi:hypothetical protein predicted by Glimmer/Critica [Sorangium cellulosum So ce56]|uniref:Uncharacterized protein n=1 Tax=Sorangium cellulosum (strain So ce56) TaxID=448385 RepID=A9EU61_SORC5|nr:hypothetical protein predicted by Glimmer/Critica [Sorangium cellulosum So ce56]
MKFELHVHWPCTSSLLRVAEERISAHWQVPAARAGEPARGARRHPRSAKRA